MKTRLLIFCLLISGYSFAQYPLTVIGYDSIAPAVGDNSGVLLIPASYIHAKGVIKGNVDLATGLYIKAENSSNLPNIGIALSVGHNPTQQNYGIFSAGTWLSSKETVGLKFNFENAGTGTINGAEMRVAGQDPVGVNVVTYTNSPSGVSTGATFAAHGNGGEDIATSAYGVDASATARTAVAVYASALGTSTSNGTSSYGIFAAASGSANNYAGYFDGNVTVTGTFSNPSDTKLKRNISRIGDALSKVMQLSPSNYEFKTDTYQSMNLSKGTHYGFLAQDVEKVFPTLVSENTVIVGRTKNMRKEPTHLVASTTNTADESEALVTENIKSVNYLEMIPILTKAIQEQQAMIEEQKNLMKKQQSQIDELKAELKQVKARK